MSKKSKTPPGDDQSLGSQRPEHGQDSFGSPIRNLDRHRIVPAQVKQMRPAPAPKTPDPPALFADLMNGVTPLASREKARISPQQPAMPAASFPEPANGVERREVARQRSRQAAQKAQETAQAAPIPTEEDIFSRAMQGVAQLNEGGRAVRPPVAPKPAPPISEEDPLRDFLEGKIEFALEFTEEFIEGHVVGLDIATVGKLRAGQFSPEAHIDLHGLSAEAARDALLAFFRTAYYKGQRTVLVVPGRGLNSPNGVGVLRLRVQDWLTQDPLKRVVLAFCTAKARDGGTGALYVLLRKFRKSNGKIYWDRAPDV